MLYEEIHQRHERPEEGAREDLPVFDSFSVRWAQREAAQRPRQRRDEIRDHEDVVPVVVVRRGDICPAAAGERAEDARVRDKLGELLSRARGEEVP